MSQKEVQRLLVLRRVLDEGVGQAVAAEQLGAYSGERDR
jgi:hypothetical protein